MEELDTESHREAFPAAFRWICCRKAADRAGCRRGRHEANPDRSRKGRGSDTDSQVSSLDGDPLRLDAEDDHVGGGGEAPGPTAEEMRMDRIRRLIGGGDDEGDAHGSAKEASSQMQGGALLGGRYRWVPFRGAGGATGEGQESSRRGPNEEDDGDGGGEDGHGGLKQSAAVMRPRSDSHPTTAACP